VKFSFISSLASKVRRSRSKKSKPLLSKRHDLKLLKKVSGKKMPAFRQLRYVRKVLTRQEFFILRGATVILIAAIVWSGIEVTGAYRMEVPAVGGAYVEAVVGSPKLVNPLFANVNDVDRDLVRLVYSGLMYYDENLQLMPDLAESYTISEDKKTYTFSLRQDVVWHDGEPFTAHDVAFTFEAIQDPDVGSPLQVSFQGIHVQVIDDYTVSFVLADQFQPFLSSLTLGILPEHIWINIPYEQIKLAKTNLQPVGTGPYTFHKLAKDDTGFVFRYELSRNESYYRNPPYIQEFVFQFFGDYGTDLGAIQALRQQKVDGLHFVPADLKDSVTRKHIQIHTLQLPQYTALFFNQKKQPYLADVDVRNALAYALDKERILRESLEEGGRVIYSPVLPGFPGFSEEIEKTPYSVEQANELLDKKWKRVSSDAYAEKQRERLRLELADQFPMASSTEENTTSMNAELESTIDARLALELNEAQLFYRQNEDGDVLQLNLVTADVTEYRQAAGLIAGFWQELGIKTNIRFISPKEIPREVLRERNYDVLLYGFIIGSDPDQYPFWHSSQVDFPGLNLSQYVNRSVDELLVKARETDNQEELAKVYTEFQEKIFKDRPAIFLHTPTYRYATSDKIKGIHVERIFHPSDRFANVTQWYIKTKGEWNFSKSE